MAYRFEEATASARPSASPRTRSALGERFVAASCPTARPGATGLAPFFEQSWSQPHSVVDRLQP
jgi:hypothetical protein